MSTISKSIQTVQKFNQQPPQNNCPVIPQPNLKATPTPAPGITSTDPEQARIDAEQEAEAKALFLSLPNVPVDKVLSESELNALLATLPSVPKTDLAIREYTTVADTDFSRQMLSQLVPILKQLEKYPKDRLTSPAQVKLVQAKNQLLKEINIERASNYSKILEQYVPKNSKKPKIFTKKQKNTAYTIVTQSEVDDVKALEDTLRLRKNDLAQDTVKQAQLETTRKELLQSSQQLNQFFQERRKDTTNLTGLTQRYNEKNAILKEKLRTVQNQIKIIEASQPGYQKEIEELAKAIKTKTEVLLLPSFRHAQKK